VAKDPKSPLGNIEGAHLRLSVAAHLARTQLVRDPLVRYDSDHLMEMVSAVARALTKVVPVYVQDGSGPRELDVAEVDGANVTDGGSVLVLKNGRRYTSASIRRADLRQAIAILKRVGVPELGQLAAEKPELVRNLRAARGWRAELDEIEALLRLPLVPAEAERAARLLVLIARDTREGLVANAAMKLMSAALASDGDGVTLLLAQLREALAEAEKN
jgi:hypothetical protein